MRADGIRRFFLHCALAAASVLRLLLTLRTPFSPLPPQQDMVNGLAMVAALIENALAGRTVQQVRTPPQLSLEERRRLWGENVRFSVRPSEGQPIACSAIIVIFAKRFHT